MRTHAAPAPIPAAANGSMNYTPEQLTELVAQFTAAGAPVATHVHGDLTCEAVLDAYARAARQESLPDRGGKGVPHVGQSGREPGLDLGRHL
ncbi:amidohydrolase family protein [Streptomyces sp. NPDC057074]|uniref:amidohydrolase family protein n=1 Tax=Streptomyces sp. NPDC057074 TaxID=3346015 RepID=UPI0036286041